MQKLEKIIKTMKGSYAFRLAAAQAVSVSTAKEFYPYGKSKG